VADTDEQQPKRKSLASFDVSLDFYGVFVSRQTCQTLRTTPSFPGGSISTRSEIRGGHSSPEITDGGCFAGCNKTFCVWGRGVRAKCLVGHTTFKIK
jgi:hypothetical protein